MTEAPVPVPDPVWGQTNASLVIAPGGIKQAALIVSANYARNFGLVDVNAYAVLPASISFLR